MDNAADADSVRNDSGFGLIEIIVSMFLLGLLAIAFLPLLVTSMKTTVVNSTTATATQLVSQQMELARGAGDTCAAITAFHLAVIDVVPDARGVSYQPVRTVGPCSAALADYPATVKVTVSVIPSTGATVSATTLIYLRAPS
ncbi:type II secretion system protein [Cryobacterium psychrophilum]|uniref:Type II secretion system protein n=1 Tax=Cryobacterium psychrophilum TaxID=41988 RepID=A0A4Y8KSN9_9MICO|nr:type II secretion system protein [Cryobacterium psychrophilum]TDW29731.1 prepilin-type N-terminal cleavage/methylation domain-containing protein [Cryobacterium psychrophilum]TFD81837.1 type II secretion system protein [Cryobacterium psychrophilum]